MRARALVCLFVSSIAVGCGGKTDGPKKVILCGNGEIDEGEICDPGIDAGMEGACPTSCDQISNDSCAPVVLEGVPGRCNVQCIQQQISECGLDDSCCPFGCDENDDSDCSSEALCGNGRLDDGEQCDPNILSGRPGACECPDQFLGECSQRVENVDPSNCSITCDEEPIEACIDGDGCCPAGCDARRDDDCGDICGDGIVGGTETCDGNCPSDCDDGLDCTQDTRRGSDSQCNVSCDYDPINVCSGGDGCCPNGCDASNDSDCSATCGDGIVDPDETCDGNCPASCDDGNACTADTLSGSAATCSSQCANVAITACTSGDGCCPNGCTALNDSDCNAVCGNGAVEGGETCDGNCPVTCDDQNACTSDVRTGTPGTCDVSCANSPITQCIDADGCCPSACTAVNDDDCSSTCGDGVVDPNETCDLNCPSSCSDGDACTNDVLAGSAGQCNAECIFQPITSCVSNDGCCPSGCTFAVDSDCSCVPDTCASLGWECGTVTDDGCNGGGEMCGVCGADEDCLANVCEPNYRVGAGCSSDVQCDPSSGVCLTEAETGYPGGYCTLACTFDAECGAGNHCGPAGFCQRSCSDDAECRTGYECFDIDGDAAEECGAVGSGAGAPGAACDSYDDCAGGQNAFCALEASTRFIGGYCLSSCATDADCPTGAHCSVDGLCLANCSTANDCRGGGYDCYDVDGDATNECYSAGTGAGQIGEACGDIADCAGGRWADCEAGFPQGYCTLDCGTGEGTCPTGSACTTPSDGDRVCRDLCQNNNQCRSGYSCQTSGGSLVCLPI